MVCIFGVATGLAVTRFKRVEWFDGLLVAFAAWYLVGCWSQAAAIVRARRPNPALGPFSAAIWFAVVTRVTAPLLVALGAGLSIAKSVPWESLRFDDFLAAQAFGFLCVGLLVVPILTTVDAPLSSPVRRGGIGSWVTATLGNAAGILLAIICIGNLLFITVLVHLAIHGVRQHQAIFPDGDYFSESVFVSSSGEAFAATAVAATGTWCLAAGLLAALAGTPEGSRRGLLFGTALAIALIAVGALALLAHRLFANQISPILSDFILADKPSWMLGLGVLLWWAAGSWLTQRMLRRGREPAESLCVVLPTRVAPYLHESLPVLLLPLTWWGFREQETFRELAESIWRLSDGRVKWKDFVWTAIDVVLQMSSLLILAYGLTWLQTAWSCWKGHHPRSLELLPVATGRLAAVWLSSLALLALAAPVWAWLCFALWTWPTKFPGESWLLMQQ